MTPSGAWNTAANADAGVPNAWKGSSMRLDRTVRQILDDHHIRYILIGAHAAAVYGVIRATRDVDLLTVDRSVLTNEMWAATGAGVTVLKGDASDPLAGTVRLVKENEQVDVVVGKWKFEQAIIDRSEPRAIDDHTILVPRPADFVLLKLAAGGPQDVWDIHELMQHFDKTKLIAEVDAHIGELPTDAIALWDRVRAETLP